MASKRGLQVRPPVGSKVRLTGYFLKSTGQIKGEEGAKRWAVVNDCGFPKPCMCQTRVTEAHAHVAVDEAIAHEGYEDIVSTRADGRLMRHIALGNLELVGAPPKAADQGDAMGPIKLPLGHPDDPPRARR
jgi:hypothetical protein